MKNLLIIISFFSLNAFAENTEDLAQLLRDSHCIPVRGSDGKISTYKCDGPLGEKIKDGKFQNLEVQKVKKMELYNTLSVGEPMKAEEKQ